MKVETVTATKLIESCTSKDRILLINPPVVELRYQWLRWNQPLDLLKMSSFLKQEIGCEVKLYDFMLPVGGKVTRTANKVEPELTISERAYPLWRYGENNEKFKEWLVKLMLTDWHPTQVWVTSLTSYWWVGVGATINLIKSILRGVKVVVYGQYPVLETRHAEENSLADLIVKDRIDLPDYPADFSLYAGNKPAFCGLDVRAKNWHGEVLDKYRSGVGDFVFFNEDILDPSNDLLQQLHSLREQVSAKANRRLKFHAICGLYPCRFTEKVAKEMKEAGFAELHFEHQPDGKELDIDAYRRAREAYHQAEFLLGPNEVSGFLFIGLPGDDLELITRHMLNLLEFWGTVILKPYTPTPGSPEYQRHRHLFEAQEIERLSPHAFPFSQVNGIAHEDYDELYTLAAALNQKVRNRSFNSFPGTLAHEMIKTSLEREVWKFGLEESVAH